MKKIVFLLTLVLTLSCSDDSEVFPEDLSGPWSLVKVMNHGTNEVTEIEEDDIIWDINLLTNQVTVTNNSPFPEYPLANGTYNIALYTDSGAQNGWRNKVEIVGIAAWFYDHSGLHLQLSDGTQNGFHYDFIRPIDPGDN